MADGTRFAIDHIHFPSSVVQRQAVMISLRVDDIHSAVEAMAKKGVRFYPSKEKTIFDVGPTLVATFEDPEGNWLQLNQIK
jgi:predicted enzyme related to lactoylglutathione lyase